MSRADFDHENLERLKACGGPHLFGLVHERGEVPTRARYRCKRCAGQLSEDGVRWYRVGLRHGFGSRGATVQRCRGQRGSGASHGYSGAALTATPKRRRGPGRPFVKGQSGNPAGARSGSRHRASIALDALAEGEANAILPAVVERAKDGDVPAATLILDRAWRFCQHSRQT